MISEIYYRLKDLFLSRKWKRSAKKSKINGYVLMYHHITDEYVNINHSCRCPIKVFEHYLEEYSRKGYKYVSIDEAYRMIRENDSTPFCVVTFDDISDDVYTNAYPILKSRQIPFTIFVTSNLVDSVDKSSNRVFITRDHFHELTREPLCTIGAHTVSHPFLRKADKSMDELINNKEWLESFCGHKVDYLAYPYGKHSSISKKIQREAQLAGFKCAFSTIDAPITDISSKQLFFLPRIVQN